MGFIKKKSLADSEDVPIFEKKTWRFLMTGMPLMLATVLTMILTYEISVEM